MPAPLFSSNRSLNAWRSAKVAWLAFVLGTTGCAAMKATQQPDKKDLGVLCPGTPRTLVIAELGAPIHSGAAIDGRPTDLFVFKQGYSKGVKVSRAFGHGVADVMTGGLWEVVGIPIECIADGTDVKVEVVYGPGYEVDEVVFLQGETVIQRRRWFARRAVEPRD